MIKTIIRILVQIIHGKLSRFCPEISKDKFGGKPLITIINSMSYIVNQR